MLKKISLLLMLVLLLAVTGCEPTEKLTGKKVKEVWFYAFATGEDFRIE